MKTSFSLALVLAAGGLLAAATALPQAFATDAYQLLANPRLSPEGREAIRTRIDAVHARFRRTHGGLSPEQFGVQCCQITQIPAAAFAPLLQGGAWSLADVYGYVSPVSGSSNLWAPVQLPSGVEVQYLGFFYYDNNASLDIFAIAFAYTGGGPGSGAPSSADLLTVSSSGASGYGYVLGDLVHTVNNLVAYDPTAAQLAVHVDVGTIGSSLGFKAVEVWWMRQVGPVPQNASFNDVPTSHPFFQYVEALAASGITAGCQAAPPLYCPDQALTRGQMAVFLSKALGLYWPN